MMSLSTTFSFFCFIKLKGFILPWVFLVMDHRRQPNVIRMSVAHSLCVLLFCSYCSTAYFNIFYDLILNRHMAKLNLLVECITNFIILDAL